MRPSWDRPAPAARTQSRRIRPPVAAAPQPASRWRPVRRRARLPPREGVRARDRNGAGRVRPGWVLRRAEPGVVRARRAPGRGRGRARCFPPRVRVHGPRDAGSVPARGLTPRAPGAAGPPMTGLLDGMRVLDLAAYRPMPHATQILADLGAEVLKIEPLGGDPMRAYPEVFASVARGKRSIVLDLRSDDGARRVRELVTSADVVCESWRP